MKINKNDKWRVLLTEVLPYETPMLFSNEGFYEIAGKDNYISILDTINNQANKESTIPFEYKIRKNIDGDTRVISIVHPKNQIDIVNFYEKYYSLILHLCSKSPLSLRSLSKVAKHYYTPDLIFDEEPHKNAELEVEPEILNIESSFLKSYFTYKPVDLIYKFYEGRDYKRLEQRFNYLMQFDINKCFYNIYTHSISWAVKSKEYAKRAIKANSFENEFDQIMRDANYGETNGIVVGPEVSRIFAEIILQQVDIDALSTLDSSFKYGVDYEVRRYVDDYFVFSNDPNILKKVKKVFEQELEKYKLYLNKAKEEIKTSPFTSSLTVGKREVHNKILELFESITTTEKEESNIHGEIITIDKKVIKEIRKPYSISRKFIDEYQNIVKRNNLSYDILGRDVIRIIKRSFTDMLRGDILGNNNQRIENFFLMMYDILFYVYSMSINSSTTFKLSQIIVLSCKFLKNQNSDIKHVVYSKIFKDAEFVLTNNLRKSKRDEADIESLNIIIAIKTLGEEYRLSIEKLCDLFSLKYSTNKIDIIELNYFHVITLLYYIDKDSQYNLLRRNLEKHIIDKFKKNEKAFLKSELTMLFFDYICCPFVSDTSKRKVLANSGYCTHKTSNTERDVMISKISSVKKWFVDWDENINLERILKNKEWGATY